MQYSQYILLKIIVCFNVAKCNIARHCCIVRAKKLKKKNKISY